MDHAINEVAELQKNMDDNEAAREEATTIRNKENADFLAAESDMVRGESARALAVKFQFVGTASLQFSPHTFSLHYGI